MGSSIILWYKEKCRKQWKTAFIATFIIGLLTHAYKFLNFLPNHDSFLNIPPALADGFFTTESPGKSLRNLGDHT